MYFGSRAGRRYRLVGNGAHQIAGEPRTVDGTSDGMSGAYLGPDFSDEEIERYLRYHGYPFERVDERDRWAKLIAGRVADEKVVGLFVGRMEFGPSALGHRTSSATPAPPRCSR